MCLDATRVDGYGRLVNHGDEEEVNLKPYTVLLDGEIRVAFLALRDVIKGEEFTFNYGDKKSDLPWLKRKPKRKVFTQEEKSLYIINLHLCRGKCQCIPFQYSICKRRYIYMLSLKHVSTQSNTFYRRCKSKRKSPLVE